MDRSRGKEASRPFGTGDGTKMRRRERGVCVCPRPRRARTYSRRDLGPPSPSRPYHGPCADCVPEPSPLPSRGSSCLRRRPTDVTRGPEGRPEPAGRCTNQRATWAVEGNGESGEGHARTHRGRKNHRYAARYVSPSGLDLQMGVALASHGRRSVRESCFEWARAPPVWASFFASPEMDKSVSGMLLWRTTYSWET